MAAEVAISHLPMSDRGRSAVARCLRIFRRCCSEGSSASRSRPTPSGAVPPSSLLAVEDVPKIVFPDANREVVAIIAYDIGFSARESLYDGEDTRRICHGGYGGRRRAISWNYVEVGHSWAPSLGGRMNQFTCLSCARC